MIHIYVPINPSSNYTLCGIDWLNGSQRATIQVFSLEMAKEKADNEYCPVCVSLAHEVGTNEYKAPQNVLFANNFGEVEAFIKDVANMSSEALWLDGLMADEFFTVLLQYLREGSRRGLRWQDLVLGIVVDRGNASFTSTDRLVSLWKEQVKNYFTEKNIEPYERKVVDTRRLQGMVDYLKKDADEIHTAMGFYGEIYHSMLEKSVWAMDTFKSVFPEETVNYMVYVLWQKTTYPNFKDTGVAREVQLKGQLEDFKAYREAENSEVEEILVQKNYTYKGKDLTCTVKRHSAVFPGDTKVEVIYDKPTKYNRVIWDIPSFKANFEPSE